LIDLPTSKSIEEVVQLLQGSSSHWINENRLLREGFPGVVDSERSQYLIHTLIKLLPTSQTNKRIIIGKSFSQEFELFVEKYGSNGTTNNHR